MPDPMPAEDAVDIAVIAFREDGVWQLEELEPELAMDFEALSKEMRRRSGDDGVIAFAAYDEDFLLVVRIRGSSVKVLLSDVTAALEWEVARGALDALEEDQPDEDDESETVGDVDLLADYGLSEEDVDLLLEDEDLYPDEVLAEMAGQIGLGTLFDEVVELTAP